MLNSGAVVLQSCHFSEDKPLGKLCEAYDFCDIATSVELVFLLLVFNHHSFCNSNSKNCDMYGTDQQINCAINQ
jgi:hypothetical protein